MLSKLYTACLVGLDCKIIEVEVDYVRGNTFFAIVGLADKSIQEAKERIPSAIKSAGYSYIPVRIIMNLAPAEVNKSGPAYDLPLALGYLTASEQINPDYEKKIFLGELALDGRLRKVNGVLPIVDGVKRQGFTEVFIPAENVNEAALVEGITIYPVTDLAELVDHLNGNKLITPAESSSQISLRPQYKMDFSLIRGQAYAKRAMEISAAGGHNILLWGTPGSGKTLLSRCLPSILPDMTFEESLEVTRVYSVAGLLSKKNPLITERPFRSPHHTTSQVAIAGGGSIPKPGEISLAHRGILFLDEFPEFSQKALEVLRQPMEDKIVSISRAHGSITFPANFMLVAAMNPCKCGYFGDQTKECICTPLEVAKYQKRISGPIMDRIDLQVKVAKVENDKLLETTNAESSEEVRNRVQAARNIQVERFENMGIYSNSEMGQKEIENLIHLEEDCKNLLNMAVNKLNLTARSYFRIIKVARTIADLETAEQIKTEHLSEALSYRIEG